MPDLSSPYGPVLYAPQTFMVGAGQESTIVLEGVTTFNVDFSDAGLELPFDTVLTPQMNNGFNAAPFNGLVFTSTAFPLFSGVTINPTTNFVGFDASRVFIVGNELRLNFADLDYDTNTLVSLSFVAAAVPEPATWLMLVGGFGLVGAAIRRQRPALRTGVRFA